MTDSNQNEFAGAVPLTGSPANWNWLRDRLPSCGLENLHNWMDDRLLELEASYEDWVTSKSRRRALQSELRDSRN
jgi:hypothetical protein